MWQRKSKRQNEEEERKTREGILKMEDYTGNLATTTKKKASGDECKYRGDATVTERSYTRLKREL